MPGQPCPKDGCDSVENATYKVTVETMKAQAPELMRVDLLPYLVVDLVSVFEAPNTDASAIGERPQNWVSVWNFVRRAAPPSRAPTACIA